MKSQIPRAVATTLRSCYKFSRSLTNKSFQYNFFFHFVQMVSTYQAGYKNRTKIIKFLETLPHSSRKILKIYACFSSHLFTYLIPGLVRNHYFFLKFWKMIIIQNKRKLVILPSLEKLEFAQNDPKIEFFDFLGKLCCYFFWI